MVELRRGLEAGRIRANLERIWGEIQASGRDCAEVEILAAVKYLPAPELSALAEAGIQVLGENRAQDLVVKHDAYPGVFTWDFIGHLQSRKVRQVLPYVRFIHSVESDSVLRQLELHAPPETEVLVQVNVAGEASKRGVAPGDLGDFLERCPVRVVGLMTMPPLADTPEQSRRYFAALRELAREHALEHLSMGTTQDYLVAVEEGATIIRLGTTLYAP